MAAVAMAVGVFEGHSPIISLFRCDFLYILHH